MRLWSFVGSRIAILRQNSYTTFHIPEIKSGTTTARDTGADD
jgi:hypothetical protein